MTCIDIIKTYLADNGFDGLANPHLDCGCDLDDLMPCASACDECVPGYRVETHEGWTMTTKKPNSLSMKDAMDIVERLRAVGGTFDGPASEFVSCAEAAAEIEHLRSLCDDLYTDLLAAGSLVPQNCGAYSLIHEALARKKVPIRKFLSAKILPMEN